MMSRRWGVILAAAAVLGACGGSDGVEVVDTAEPTPTTTIDLADGAFIRNEGVVLDADGAPATTPTTLAPDAATPTTLAGNAATATTLAGGGSAPDGGATAAGETTSGAAAVGPGQALIVIDGVSYEFAATDCEVASDAVAILGRGTARDGAPFEASMFLDVDDLDGDGTPDRILEIFVDPEGAAGSGAVPSFSASTLDILGNGSAGTLAFEIVGQRIFGTGTIVDFNGVAFPVDQPRPLTFDANCA